MATRENTLTRRFFSLARDEEAEGRNLFAQRLGPEIHWLHPHPALLLRCLRYLYLEQAKAGIMVHSWPGLHTHHLIFPDQHLPRAFEAPVKLSPTFEQKPDLLGFKALSGKRSFGTWIAWFLPMRWTSWEAAFRPHYVKEKCLKGGCVKCCL